MDNKMVGEILRNARKARGWTLQKVESETEQEFKASVVGAYERGERAISLVRFIRLMEWYGHLIEFESVIIPALASFRVTRRDAA